MKWIVFLMALVFSYEGLAATIVGVSPKKRMIVLIAEQGEASNISTGETIQIISHRSNSSFPGKIIAKRQNRLAVRVQQANTRPMRNESVSIIKMTDMNQAIASDKFTGLYMRFNPVALLTLGVSASLGFEFANNFTLGLEGMYSQSSVFVDTQSYSLGPQLGYFFSGACQDSAFIKASGGYGSAKIKPSETETDIFLIGGKQSYYYGGAYLGYQWMWSTGINFSLGIGAQYDHYTQIFETKSSLLGGLTRIGVEAGSGIIRPTGELSLGLVI